MISWFEKHYILSWLITIIIAVIIFYMSTLTFQPGSGTASGWKSIVYHFFAFFFLSAFLLMSMVRGKKFNLIMLGLITAVIYGVSDEFHQLFVPGRYCSLSDVLIDSTGILFAGIIYSVKLLKSKSFS